VENGSRQGQSKYQENGLEKSTWKLENKVGELLSHTSSNVAYCEIPHKKGWTKTPSAIRGPLGPLFYPVNKPNMIADCLENQFRARDLCDCDHRRHVKAQFPTLWRLKRNTVLEIRKGLWHLRRIPLVHLTYFFTHCLRLGHFSAPWMEAKIISLPNHAKTLNLPRICVPSASCLLRTNYLRRWI
jgi:hypothetical protein